MPRVGASMPAGGLDVRQAAPGLATARMRRRSPAPCRDDAVRVRGVFSFYGVEFVCFLPPQVYSSAKRADQKRTRATSAGFLETTFDDERTRFAAADT